jgi:hypothetical protein
VGFDHTEVFGAHTKLLVAIPGGGLADFTPEITNMTVIASTKDSLTLEAKVSINNPTNYSATVPFADVNILSNDTVLGHATAKNLLIRPRSNDGIEVQAVWGVSGSSSSVDNKTRSVGRELLSQFVSGTDLGPNRLVYLSEY